MSDYRARVEALQHKWGDGPGVFRLAKRTISNRFRYRTESRGVRPGVDLSDFHHVLRVDPEQLLLEAEGLTTMATAVDATFAQGLLPRVAPELKHITLGGATVGIGIESSGFQYGFLHDALVEADVLLPDGRVLTCRADNEYADLFHALPNSYGTLGYILRVVLRLRPAMPFVHTRIYRFNEANAFLEAMRSAAERREDDFIEGLFFGDGRHFLLLSRLADNANPVDDILRKNIFYRLVQQRDHIHLHTRDYIFRFDPEWFWNIPLSQPYQWFRRFAPARFRNSGFYARYAAWQQHLRTRLPWARPPNREPLIQDWEVPWSAAAELMAFCLQHVALGHRPWAAIPIRPLSRPTLYPVDPDILYFNLGSYCQVPRQPGKPPYHDTRIIDDQCFALGGIKMLYSSTFLDRERFDRLYNGDAYHALKQKYDPQSRADTLYDKVAM
jgi:FAD/FMN-containing dehydrogenase